MYQAKSGVKIFSFYCWGGGGGSLNKNNFFSSLNMYQAKSGVKIFSLYRKGEGPSTKNFFFQSEHVSSQIWCQKFFPLPLGGGGARGRVLSDKKIFFSSLNMYQAKSGVKIISLYQWSGGGGVPGQKIFFSSLNMYQAKSAVKNFSLY